MPPIRYKAVSLGPLPVDAINAVLGTELLPGTVRLSATAHKHMAEGAPSTCWIEVAMVGD